VAATQRAPGRVRREIESILSAHLREALLRYGYHTSSQHSRIKTGAAGIARAQAKVVLRSRLPAPSRKLQTASSNHTAQLVATQSSDQCVRGREAHGLTGSCRKG